MKILYQSDNIEISRIYNHGYIYNMVIDGKDIELDSILKREIDYTVVFSVPNIMRYYIWRILQSIFWYSSAREGFSKKGIIFMKIANFIRKRTPVNRAPYPIHNLI